MFAAVLSFFIFFPPVSHSWQKKGETTVFFRLKPTYPTETRTEIRPGEGFKARWCVDTLERGAKHRGGATIDETSMTVVDNIREKLC